MVDLILKKTTYLRRVDCLGDTACARGKWWHDKSLMEREPINLIKREGMKKEVPRVVNNTAHGKEEKESDRLREQVNK